MALFPADFAQRYRQQGYWIGQTHTALLEQAAQRHPERVAVIDDRRSLSYADLLTGSRALAHGFAAAGWEPGQRVVVHLPNVSEYLEVIFGLYDAGLVPVFALASHGRSEIDDLLTRSEAVGYVTADRIGGQNHLGVVAELSAEHPGVGVAVVPVGDGSTGVLPGLDGFRGDGSASTGRSSGPEELAFLQLSGGTTGAPKLIPRSHDDYLYSVRESAAICGLTDDSVFGVVLPVSHNFTMSSPGVLGAVHAGSPIVMIGGPDPDSVFAAVAQHGITHLSVVPPLLAAWIDSTARTRYDLSSLQVVGVGGAKLSRSLAERVPQALGATLQQVFGMAEGLVNYTRLDDDLETIVATQGRPISPDDEIRIVDREGRVLPDGEAGSLQTRGPYTIRSYWHGTSAASAADAARTADSFTDDGFYITGDLAVRDARGYLTVVGRDKDQINRAGEKISPEEIENLLLALPGVRDVSVVGVADDRLGERIVAYLIPSETRDEPLPDAFAIRGHLREQGLAQFKIPDQIEVVDEFPTTAVGKVSKNAQRDGSAPDSGDGAAPAAAPTAQPEPAADAGPGQRVRADLAAKLGLDVSAITGSIPLADTGIDSLSLMALLDKWRAGGAQGLDFEELAQAETVDELVSIVLDAQE